MQALEEMLSKAEAEIASAADLQSLENHRVHYLGKKGQLTEYLKTLGKLPADERPAAGQKINNAKDRLQNLIEEKVQHLKEATVTQQLKSDTIDVTLPGRKHARGSIHPINQTFDELRSIFSKLGFSFMEGPEIEEEHYNFTALNMPPLHPSRAMQDTFYTENNLLLRSQMSPVQIRTLELAKPPLRMVAMGRVYRRDFDLTHTPMFHQMECLMVDKDITFADLKGLLHYFLKSFFDQENLQMRLRPSYFPFTEPSAEVDIGCVKCAGSGCRICKYTGWLEILGCGMVHPNVLKTVHVDSHEYRGFAFGLGIDRLTMLKYNINDLRALFENDLRFLQQF